MAYYAFPAVFSKEEEGNYSIFFKDIDGCFTGGDDINDGMMMAGDALALMLVQLEDEGKTIPKPSELDSIEVMENEFVTLVGADTDDYRQKLRDRDRLIKKTLTIPKWLNEDAMDEGINFSQVLQEALKAKLGISD